MADPTILGPDGRPANPPPPPPWVAGLSRGLRVQVAGWWFKVEDPVTDGEGQWALILSPVEQTAASRKRAMAAMKEAARAERKFVREVQRAR